MTRTAGGSAISSPPDRAVWTRVPDVQEGAPLDLLTARFGRQHYAPHVHDEYAIGVCVDGLETMRYRGERIFSAAGSILVVEPGETHTGGPAGPDGYAYLALYPGAATLRAVGGGGVPHFGRPVIDDPELATAMRLTHRELRRGGDPLEGESRLLWLLGELVRRHAEPAGEPAAPPGSRVARLVSERLADELTAPPTLAVLAGDLGLSRYQLLRAFRSATGMPPYAWLAQHRVARARALLDAGLRPAEAASLVGFADQAHLTRWFRRVLGVTPGAYRNSVQDGGAPRPAA
ncbi:helix-turn-helix domain-containing protein [Actinomadura macrotermitis]|uniref:HTH-type transcriptional activator RhaR n=1 Tax=Actinomadura macrotermitis TaxID=2585200 RepID=A0A7K0BVQ5_9ACTN|nr:HTH-type transcriptional activator RhaR [Actinomadura macrotermitis]